jgi:hypothetical protein
VGAHPVGDWYGQAERMQSPTGVGSYKQPLSLLVLPLQEPDPRGRLACLGGTHQIAHSGGLL